MEKIKRLNVWADTGQPFQPIQIFQIIILEYRPMPTGIHRSEAARHFRDTTRAQEVALDGLKLLDGSTTRECQVVPGGELYSSEGSLRGGGEPCPSRRLSISAARSHPPCTSREGERGRDREKQRERGGGGGTLGGCRRTTRGGGSLAARTSSSSCSSATWSQRGKERESEGHKLTSERGEAGVLPLALPQPSRSGALKSESAMHSSQHSGRVFPARGALWLLNNVCCWLLNNVYARGIRKLNTC